MYFLAVVKFQKSVELNVVENGRLRRVRSIELLCCLGCVYENLFNSRVLHHSSSFEKKEGFVFPVGICSHIYLSALVSGNNESAYYHQNDC